LGEFFPIEFFFGDAKDKCCLGSIFFGGGNFFEFFCFSFVNLANFQYHKIEKRNHVWSFLITLVKIIKSFFRSQLWFVFQFCDVATLAIIYKEIKPHLAIY
jgi:hypothetical protein